MRGGKRRDWMISVWQVSKLPSKTVFKSLYQLKSCYWTKIERLCFFNIVRKGIKGQNEWMQIRAQIDTYLIHCISLSLFLYIQQICICIYICRYLNIKKKSKNCTRASYLSFGAIKDTARGKELLWELWQGRIWDYLHC